MVSSLVFGKEEPVMISVVDVDNAPLDFSDMDNLNNPFKVLTVLKNAKFMVSPPKRAQAYFCSPDFSIIYPLLGGLNCEAEIIPVFNVTTNVYSWVDIKSIKTIGVRRGFNYDASRIKSIFPNFSVLTEIADDDQLVGMFKLNRVDAVLLEDFSAKVNFKKQGVSYDQVFVTEFLKVPVSIGVKPHLKDHIYLLKRELIKNQ